MAKIGEVTSLGNLVNTDYDDREIKRCEVYYVDLEDIGYTTKHIQSKTRPALIIQNDIGNDRGTTVIVALMTTASKKPYPFQYHIEMNGRESVILFEQIMTIDKSRILEKMGELTHKEMMEAEQRLMYSLQLDKMSLENIQDIEVVSVVSRKTRTSDSTYFEIDIIFSNDKRREINVSVDKLKSFNKTIDKDIGFDDLKKLLDCCKGLNWLVNNSEI